MSVRLSPEYEQSENTGVTEENVTDTEFQCQKCDLFWQQLSPNGRINSLV